MKTRIGGIGSALTLALATAWPALAHEVYPVPASYVRHLPGRHAPHGTAQVRARKPWLFGTPPELCEHGKGLVPTYRCLSYARHRPSNRFSTRDELVDV